jgi:hypothetical protein
VHVWKVLGALCGELLPKGIEPVTLADAVQWEITDNPLVDPDRAVVLVESFSVELLEEIRRRGHADAELTAVQSQLETAQFLARDQRYHNAQSLLVLSVGSADAQEEAMRAAFAPDDRVLSPNYRSDTIILFKACRGNMRATPEEMAGWSLAATTAKGQRAVLDYLLRGEKRIELSDVLRLELKSSPDCWLNQIESNELFIRLGSDDRWEIRLRLGRLPTEGVFAPPLVKPEAPEPTAIDAKACLVNIYEWWMENQAKLLPQYERHMFPFPIKREALIGAGHDEIKQRKQWMALFMLGMCHTIGRSRFAQHRDFIQLCETKGILDQLADGSIEPGAWVRRALDYADSVSGDTIEYYEWFKQMFGASMMSHWLDVYRRTFQAADKMRFDFELGDLICTKTSRHIQGAPDFLGPPLRQVLGMGACFVMRELARRRIIQNPRCYRFCYVPHRRTRILLTHLGCTGLRGTNDRGAQSERIYSFLCEHLDQESATFGRAFDIPFLMLEYFGKSKRTQRHEELFKRQIDASCWPQSSTDGDFVTLWDGRVIPRSYMD